MPISIVKREKINNVLFYRLENGWEIMTAQCSRDRQGVARFSLWRPDQKAWGGAVCVGGAETLKACLIEAERLSPPAPALDHGGLFEKEHPCPTNP